MFAFTCPVYVSPVDAFLYPAGNSTFMAVPEPAWSYTFMVAVVPELNVWLVVLPLCSLIITMSRNSPSASVVVRTMSMYPVLVIFSTARPFTIFTLSKLKTPFASVVVV